MNPAQTYVSFEYFDRNARAGKSLTVAFLGGSLTWGARASDPLKTSYRAIVSRKLEERYPNAHFKFIDAAIGGTGSQLGAFRMDRDVLAYKPDLLFLDFTLNDDAYRVTPGTLAAQEAIIRRTISEAHCPVIQLFLAAKKYVEEKSTEPMTRRTAHLQIAESYNVPCGDAISLMQERHKQGKISLDEIWPPEIFDVTHPCDKGYELYAEAAWNAFTAAISNGVVCRMPEQMLYADTYMRPARIKLSSLAPLPKGWKVAIPGTAYCGFDFLMSRWMDDITVASNFVAVDSDNTIPATPAEPLKLTFAGSTVLLFGEATERSCECLARIDGKPVQFDARQLGAGTGRMWKLLAEDLDPSVGHQLELHPIFKSANLPQELRIESVCVAGGNSNVWKN